MVGNATQTQPNTLSIFANPAERAGTICVRWQGQYRDVPLKNLRALKGLFSSKPPSGSGTLGSSGSSSDSKEAVQEIKMISYADVKYSMDCCSEQV